MRCPWVVSGVCTEALQIQVCRHFAFEKTRLQQQVQFLHQCMAALTSLQVAASSSSSVGPSSNPDGGGKETADRSASSGAPSATETDESTRSKGVFLSAEDRVLLVKTRKRFLRGVQQLDTMFLEIQNFAKKHRKTLFGAIRQQHDHLKHRMQKEAKDEGRERAGEEEEEQEIEEEDGLDPMKDIASLYADTKREIAPFLANLCKSW